MSVGIREQIVVPNRGTPNIRELWSSFLEKKAQEFINGATEYQTTYPLDQTPPSRREVRAAWLGYMERQANTYHQAALDRRCSSAASV